ncbi:FtsK/SpoIIIE domain-containing protein [Streptomyces fuscigenes]|uniref:FtsK/SpoIIIE domain-containing protein n=1 Tax=Streptomyces fuscigenes TaxID=1528880 RepID=UPI001F1B20B6|nr:FtsK/SpoIIIE domain-containing protein [Streptomyces fuscigenes]MCF3960470.1 hypothetical protein [Streptomyces fuscigenes]
MAQRNSRSRRYHDHDHSGSDELYGQAAGAVGGIVIVFGGLAAIKDKLGLSWPATVLVTAGGLVGLGYLAWRIRNTARRLWAREDGKEAPAVLREESPAGEAAVAPDLAHPQLTSTLLTAGAIGRDQVIRADEVTIEQVKTGTVYDFLMPPGRTYGDVERRLGQVAGVFGVTRLHLTLDRSRDSERRARLLVLDQPPFTQPFPTPTRAEIAAFPGVPFGHDVTGQLAGVPTFEKASLLVGGMTQMGKTTLINGLITCLLIAYGEFDLYLLDGKFCGLTRFSKIATRYEASDQPVVFESIVDELNTRSERRYTKMQEAIKNRQPAPKFRPVFFIVDEAADFFANDGSNEGKEDTRRIAEKTRSLVAKCLESGISTILLTQRPAQNAIPVMVRDQFLYRMCMYVASEGTAKVALGDTYFETVAPINPALLNPDIKGQGVLFANGRSTLLRGFDFHDKFVWDVVDEVESRQQKAVEEAPISPLKQGIDLMRQKGVEFMPTSELAPALGIEETTPVMQGRRLSALLGAASSKDDKGVRGYRLTDLTAALMSGS